MKAENPILADLQSYFPHIEVLNIGDSWGVRKIMDGVREGRNILTTLEKIGALPTEEIEDRIPVFA